VRAIEPVAEYVAQAEKLTADEPRVTTHEVAVTMQDGPLRMQITHDPQSRSVSSAGLYDTEKFTEVPGRTLPSLMRELGDERIDLLKLDIEGAEYEVLPTLDLRALGVRVFSTQLHHTGSVAQARALIAGLREQGYVPVACRPVVKLTFMREEDVAGARAG
jgi:FkbM family methyltransferase